MGWASLVFQFIQHTDSDSKARRGDCLDIVDGHQPHNERWCWPSRRWVEVLGYENSSGKEKSQSGFKRQDLREQCRYCVDLIDCVYAAPALHQPGLRSSTSERNYLGCVGWGPPWVDEQQDFLPQRFQVVLLLYCRISRRVPVLRSKNARVGRDWLLTTLLKAFHLASLPSWGQYQGQRRFDHWERMPKRTSWPSVRPLSSIGYASGPRASRRILWQGEVDYSRGVNLDRWGQLSLRGVRAHRPPLSMSKQPVTAQDDGPRHAVSLSSRPDDHHGRRFFERPSIPDAGGAIVTEGLIPARRNLPPARRAKRWHRWPSKVLYDPGQLRASPPHPGNR